MGPGSSRTAIPPLTFGVEPLRRPPRDSHTRPPNQRHGVTIAPSVTLASATKWDCKACNNTPGLGMPSAMIQDSPSRVPARSACAVIGYHRTPQQWTGLKPRVKRTRTRESARPHPHPHNHNPPEIPILASVSSADAERPCRPLRTSPCQDSASRSRTPCRRIWHGDL